MFRSLIDAEQARDCVDHMNLPRLSPESTGLVCGFAPQQRDQHSNNIDLE